MTYQEFLRKVKELTNQKDALYDIASRKLSRDDKDGSRFIYAEIDEVQAELDALINPQGSIANDEELTLKFDS